MQRLLANLLNFLLPPRCTSCGRPVGASGAYCPACWSDCQFLAPPVCICCGVPFPVSTGGDTGCDLGFDMRCGDCLAAQPSYDWCRSAFAYGGPARRDILRLKHGRRLDSAAPLAAAMAAHLSGCPAGVRLVPVPLHPRRLASRRFNQAYSLAAVLSRRTGYGLDTDSLYRRRHSQTQNGLGRSGRRRNVSGAFGLRPGADVRGQGFVLVDDVFTTGATLESAAKTLKAGGAGFVGAITAARVVRSVPGAAFGQVP